jgi:hypothetical protein
MGSCASTLRRKEMQLKTINNNNVPYQSYTSKNNGNYKVKTGIQMKNMTNDNTNNTPRYT